MAEERGPPHYADAERRANLLKSLGAKDTACSFESEVVRGDGQWVWVRENVQAICDAAGNVRFLQGTVEDISAQRWQQQRRQLQYAATRIFNEASEAGPAISEVFKTVCAELEWDLGAVWVLEAETTRSQEFWHRPNLGVSALELAQWEDGSRPTPALANGGWADGAPRWIEDLAKASDHPNAELVVKLGMRCGLRMPIKVGGQVRYVFEFYSSKHSNCDPDRLQSLADIGTQLGYFVDRKSSGLALRKSEIRNAAILQSASDAIMSFDEGGTITECNPAAEKMFGYAHSELLGRKMNDLLAVPSGAPDGLQEFTLAALGAMDGGGFGRRMELVARRHNDTEVPVEIALSRIYVDEVASFTAYLRDVSDRKQANRIAFELAAVVKNSNDAIVGCNLAGTIRSWNAGAERIYGYAAEEALGQPIQMLVPTADWEALESSFNAVKSGDDIGAYEAARLCKDGRRITLSLTDSPVRDENGRISGLACIGRDVTEHKRLEEELLQSQKLETIGRLAGGVAHDFNNILTAILGYSDLIISQVDERQWMHKHLIEIRKSAEFAASLTHQLLAFSRRQPLELQVFNINDTVRMMQKMLERVIGEQVKIQTELLAPGGYLKADKGQLEQVLLNLCVNSRDAMPKGGVITIETADISYSAHDSNVVNEMPAGEYVKLTVSDTGTGMPPEVVKHIFEPFFTTKQSGEGTGLGLSTCYGIVKQSGGYIVVDSRVGRGTAFDIYLPRVEALSATLPEKKPIGNLPGGAETILYVEDEETVRRVTSHVLKRLGYTVYEASDASEAMAIMEQRQPEGIDLFFCDVVLPGVGGSELSAWIQARCASAKLLFTSGYTDENILLRHGIAGDMAFLQKPFSPGALAAKVREVIDGTAG